jgi:hypothetical protein
MRNLPKGTRVTWRAVRKAPFPRPIQMYLEPSALCVTSRKMQSRMLRCDFKVNV